MSDTITPDDNPTHPCPWCGEPVAEFTANGRPPTFCGVQCRYDCDLERRRDRRRAKRLAARREAA